MVERLSHDLIAEFPGTSGFSARNLWNIKHFYEEYKDNSILQQLVAEIPWGQNLLIMEKVSDVKARRYYIKTTAEMGWSRNVLLNQIKANAYERHMLKTKQHNFERALPVHLADQADKAMKDVYMLDFLGITKPIVEREIERRMVSAIKDVLLEFGYGFSFLCADRDHLEVEYALRGIQKPMGVAEYRLTNKLPKTLVGKLPDVKKLKQKIIKELKSG